MGEFEIISISDIQPDDNNANKGTERGTYMLRKSLEKLGAGRSIVLDKHGRIIAGNKTAESAADIGLDDVIVVRTDGKRLVAVMREDLDLDDPTGTARELAYADNRTGQVSLDWDADVLLQDIDAGMDLGDWFKDFELAELGLDIAGDDPQDAAPQIDRAEELREKWQVEPGQTWQVGSHTLYCGDAKQWPFDRADGILTDPPYDLDAGRIIEIFGGISDAAMVLTSDAQMVALSHLWPLRINLVWHHRQPRSFPTEHMPILNHHQCVLITKAMKVKHGWKRPVSNFSSVIQIDVPEFIDSEFGHGKAVEVFEEMLRGFSWETVADPFLGTGSTVITCERLRRQCNGVEITPATFAVALQRISDALGVEPQLC